MADDHSSDPWCDQSGDPFGEEFYLVPPDELIRARAEQVHQDNQDALRHFVELAIWEALDNPDHLKVLISLLWNWKAINPLWLAEAAFMTVGDVRDIAESQPIMAFPCLDCGTELVVRNRRHRIRMQSSLEDHRQDEAGNGPPADLLCETCQEQRKDHAEQQRLLDIQRQQALLAEYRARPYADRRDTREWAVLKRQVHRRDGYRCRLCGRDDVQLHVHHRTYATYAEEKLEDLITLCCSCHEHFHFWSEAS
jgi:5-methylcytosine-specific restriction endonuclease McrA